MPVAEGYTFLGYAYAAVASSKVLTFAHCDLSANAAKDDVYYLIWAVDRDKVSFAGITEEGNTPATENVTATEGSLYGWYTDETFATEVEEISISKTVLYARLQFNVTVSFEASSTLWAYTVSENTTSLPSEASSKKSLGNISIDNGTQISKLVVNVSEGQTVSLNRYWSDGFIVRVYNVDGNISANYLVFGFNSSFNKGEKRKQLYDTNHYVDFTSGNWIANSSEVTNISGTNRYYQAYSNTNNDLLFGTAMVDGYISCTVKA